MRLVELKNVYYNRFRFMFVLRVQYFMQDNLPNDCGKTAILLWCFVSSSFLMYFFSYSFFHYDSKHKYLIFYRFDFLFPLSICCFMKCHCISTLSCDQQGNQTQFFNLHRNRECQEIIFTLFPINQDKCSIDKTLDSLT